MSASAGYVVAAPGDTADVLVRNADLAMYASNGSVRGGPRATSRECTRTPSRASSSRPISEALGDGELALVYQPIVRLSDGQVVGVEALARWHHRSAALPPRSSSPRGGEQTDRPARLLGGEEGCEQLARWRAALPGARGLGLSVNVSARQLEHGPLVEEVAAILDVTGIDPSDLLLEVTETIAVGGARPRSTRSTG